MKLYKMILDHTSDEIGNEFYVVCNSMSSVVDYSKSLGLDHVDYEIKSIALITEDVIVRQDG